jgi:hypothetical protein
MKIRDSLFGTMVFLGSSLIAEPSDRPTPVNYQSIKFYSATLSDQAAQDLYKAIPVQENFLPVDPHGPDRNQQIITKQIDIGDRTYIDRNDIGGNIRFVCEQRYPEGDPKSNTYKCVITVHNFTTSGSPNADRPKFVIIQELSE